MTAKARLSATVDEEVLAAGRAAVAAGRAEHLSSWVNEALHRQADLDRRLVALDRLIAEHEAEHGEITDAEMAEARRAVASRAVVIRGRR